MSVGSMTVMATSHLFIFQFLFKQSVPKKERNSYPHAAF